MLLQDAALFCSRRITRVLHIAGDLRPEKRASPAAVRQRRFDPERLAGLLASGLVCLSAFVCAERASAARIADRQAEARRPAETDMWPYRTSVERTGRDGAALPPSIGYFWLPPGARTIRGLIVAQKIIIETRLVVDPLIRKTAETEKLGILYFDPGFDALFNWKDGHAGERLEQALADLAKRSGHPEVEFAPMLTIGHSTAGIFARNIACWKPERVIGIIHIKSGNMHQYIYDPMRTLAGVPFLAVNGEFEEFGPEGGIRPEYGKETQWIMMRQSILERRAKEPDYLMSMLVDPGGSHTSWTDALTRYCALFIAGAVKARVPRGAGTPDRIVRCLPIRLESGWLTDADIKRPKHAPAPYRKYDGDRSRAFWHLNRALAEAAAAFHDRKFTAQP